MKVAVVFRNRHGEFVDPREVLLAPKEHVVWYFELPLTVGGFNAILIRKGNPKPDNDALSVNCFYIDKSMESGLHDGEKLEAAGFIGDLPYLPQLSYLMRSAPAWIVEGLKYARAVYKPLLSFDKKAAVGLVDMAHRHPKAFAALARAKPAPDCARKRFAIAYVMSEAARCTAAITVSTQTHEVARLIGKKLDENKHIKTLERQIKTARANSRKLPSLKSEG